MNEVGEDLLDENAWQLEEEQYDWEPPSDTEQEAEEAAAEQEVEEPRRRQYRRRRRRPAAMRRRWRKATTKPWPTGSTSRQASLRA